MKTGKKSPKKPGAGQPKPSGPAAADKPAATDDDDPFAIETTAQKTAVRVALRRSPGRDYKVKCPMCETVGYVPKTAAGSSVKCANPSCMVPVFEAPEIKEEEEPQEEESKKTSPAMIVAAVLMMGVAGFSIWFFVLREPGPPADDPFAAGPGQDQNQFTETQQQTDETDEQQQEPEPEPEFDYVAFRQQLLDDTMLEIARSRERNSKRNRPADCRQLLAETYARLNQLEKAQEQLPFIDRMSPDTYFNKRVTPLIEIAWRLENPDDVRSAIAQAEKAAEEVPTAGRSRFDNLSALGALLVAHDRPDDARRWIEEAVSGANINDPVRFDLLRQSSSHMRVVRDLPEYPFSPLIDHPAHRWFQPEWVTVTMLLAAHGQDDQAVQWAKRSPQDRVKGDSLLAYSRWKIQQGKMTADQAIALVQAEPVVNRMRVLAEAARQFHNNDDQDSAGKLLSTASQEAESFPVGDEFVLPSPAEILELRLADPAPVMNRVLALSALARAQVAGGDTEGAFQTVQTALKMCRSIGPSPSALASRPHDQDDPGAGVVERDLKAKLKLKTDNEVRKSFNDYVSRLDSFADTADLRFAAEEALLSEAVSWGLVRRVWEEMQSRIDEPDPELKEPWLQSELLPEVAIALEAEGAADQLNELKRRIGSRMPDRDPQRQLLAEFDGMVEQRDFANLPQVIESSGIDREQLEAALVDRLRVHAGQGEFDLMADMIKALPQRLQRRDTDLSLVREELYLFLGRIAAQAGHAREIVSKVTNQSPSPTEEISLLAGVALGLKDAKSPAATAAKDGSATAGSGGETSGE